MKNKEFEIDRTKIGQEVKFSRGENDRWNRNCN